MRTTALAALLATAALPALAQDTVPAARAALTDVDGTEVGTVYIRENPSGYTTVSIALTDMPEGAHGVHVHETGDCGDSGDGPFTAAGGHLAEGAEHGVGAEGGPHPGDLPNAIVGADGAMDVEYFNDLLTTDMLFDDDGAAFIVHADADDYESQPSGEAGGRIACGIFEQAEDAASN